MMTTESHPSKEVGLEEAEGLLKMSRHMVAHRLRLGDIPYRWVGAEMRLKLFDVLAFKAKQQAIDEALAEIGDHTDDIASRYGI